MKSQAFLELVSFFRQKASEHHAEANREQLASLHRSIHTMKIAMLNCDGSDAQRNECAEVIADHINAMQTTCESASCNAFQMACYLEVIVKRFESSMCEWQVADVYQERFFKSISPLMVDFVARHELAEQGMPAPMAWPEFNFGILPQGKFMFSVKCKGYTEDDIFGLLGKSAEIGEPVDAATLLNENEFEWPEEINEMSQPVC